MLNHHDLSFGQWPRDVPLLWRVDQNSESCPECGSSHLFMETPGTQRVEEELRTLFPDARILRMDADTTAARYAHEQLLASFGAGRADILLGTQMVTKGLDFENVTLVGVLDADQSLYAQDFRARERTFSLITQVVGRAGRRDKQGRAVIQTFSPEHPVILAAARQDYLAFYERELEMRARDAMPAHPSAFAAFSERGGRTGGVKRAVTAESADFKLNGRPVCGF